jgi:hypothetical protein
MSELEVQAQFIIDSESLKTRADLMERPAWKELFIGTDTSGNPCVWVNHYECSNCSDEEDESHWTDRWSCQCDDDCPACGHSMSAHVSNWIGPTDELEKQLWEMLPEA